MKMSEYLAKLEDLNKKVSEAQGRLSEAQSDLEAAEKDLKDFTEGTEDAEVCFAGDPCYDTGESKPEPKASIKPVEATVTKGEKEEKKAKPKRKSTKGKKVTDQSKKNAAEGRRAVANGERPPLKKAIITVMGDQIMNAPSIVKALDEKGWKPSSNDPPQYVSFILSSNQPDIFERTEKRGYYRVRPGYLASQAGASKKKPAAKAKKEAPSKDPLDEKIEDQWGDNVSSDPYQHLDG